MPPDRRWVKIRNIRKGGLKQFNPAHSLVRLSGLFDSFRPENASRNSVQPFGTGIRQFIWSADFQRLLIQFNSGILAFVLSMLLVAETNQ
ncbi:hypothetical protein CEXT_162231 [Caerostris extrusa]|uniref:Uncharacterized protein n=1 Tax=Caerostris extrusa TaxID=172846 RepID=A0AAV4XAP9_CAEEX|nr:hypothetical protein CEXT_162231 [Caerostris extrusa]